MKNALPILYSFRRCPYAMRTRMTLIQSGIQCELREIVLRDKPPAMLQASAKGTVPVMVQPDGTVLDESLDIMLWALRQNDPGNWLGGSKKQTSTDQGNGVANTTSSTETAEMLALIDHLDGQFKQSLDRYKYASRYTDENDGRGVNPIAHRDNCITQLAPLTERLSKHPFLFGSDLSIADIATAPFVRQFANTDPAWFQEHAPQPLRLWLDSILSSQLFKQCMVKYRVWPMQGPGDPFPPESVHA